MGEKSKDRHERLVAEAQTKAEGMQPQNGLKWVVRTVARLRAEGFGTTDNPDEERIEDQIIQVADHDPARTARVNVTKALTMNLSNYESARVAVGFECPCFPEEMAEVREALNTEVERQMRAEVLLVRGKDIRPGHEAERQKTAVVA